MRDVIRWRQRWKMALIYDFDMVAVQPDVVFSDARLSSLMKSPNGRARISLHHVAQFRSPATIRAFRQAAQPLRTYLIASGFSAADYASDVPLGIFPLREDPMRIRLLERMAVNAERFLLPKVDQSPQRDDQFQLTALLAHLAEARGVPDDALDDWLATRRARHTAPSDPAAMKPAGLMSRLLGRVPH